MHVTQAKVSTWILVNLELESLWLIELEQEMVLMKCSTSHGQAMFLISSPRQWLPRSRGDSMFWWLVGEKSKCYVWFSKNFNLSRYVYKVLVFTSWFLQEKLKLVYAFHVFNTIVCVLIFGAFTWDFKQCMPCLLLWNVSIICSLMLLE